MASDSHLDFESSLAAMPEGTAVSWGFKAGEIGTHSSRTMMLEDFSILCDAVPEDASFEDYANAVNQDNCLSKRTAANRKITLQHLRELYALNRRCKLFAVLRALWGRDDASRPLLALILALARDPLLRATAPSVLQTPQGHEFSRQPMKDALKQATDDRLNEDTLDKVVRNASSSWTQSGHLRGRGRKYRQPAQATPIAAAYALLMGFLAGRRGRLIFDTPWARLLDVDSDQLVGLAFGAKRLGLLDIKQSGAIVEISFSSLFAKAGGASR